MKRTFEKLLLASSLILTLASPALAQPKIAVIDLRKVFDKYYKTQAANTILQEEVAKIQKEGKAHLEAHQRAVDEYKKALDDANNQAVSADERDKRKQAAETKLLEIKELEQIVQQYERTAQGQITEQRRQAHEKIMNDIRTIASNKAKELGYTLVLNSDADSAQTPIVVYTSGTDDITTTVLTQLNSTAPPGTVLDAKDDKPVKNGKK